MEDDERTTDGRRLDGYTNGSGQLIILTILAMIMILNPCDPVLTLSLLAATFVVC